MAAKLKDLQSIEQLISEMSVADKARLVVGGTPFHSEALPEYGIPAMYMLDSCNGFNETEHFGDSVYIATAEAAEKAGKPLDREQNGFMGGLLIAFANM